MFCPHCGRGLPDGAQFCTQCGARLAPPQQGPQGGCVSATEFFGASRAPEPRPQTGPEMDPTFDPNLDAGLEEAMSATEFFGAPHATEPRPQAALENSCEPHQAPPAPPAPPQVLPEAPLPPQTPPSGKRRGSKGTSGRKSRRGLIIALAVLLVAAIGVGVFFLVRALLRGGAGDHIFYLQEDRLMYLARTGEDAVPVMEGVDGAAVAMTPDGKYAALLLSDGYQLTLCRVELSKLGKDLSKNLSQIQVIDTEVNDNFWSYYGSQQIYELPNAQDLGIPAVFSITDDGTVYYITSASSLNRFTGGAPETVAQEVDEFLPSEDGSRILLCWWWEGAYSLTLWTADGTQVVSDSACQLVYTSPDLSQICYDLEGDGGDGFDTYDLYAWEQGQSRLLAEDTSGYYQMTGPDQFLYLSPRRETYTLSQFVEDDMAGQDASMTRPTYEDYRTTEIYTDFLGNERERTVTDYDAYQEAYDRYREKLNRDRLRERLEDESYDWVLYSLYLRQDGADALICDRVDGWDLMSEQVMVYYRYPDGSDIPTVPISQIEDLWDVEAYLEESGMYNRIAAIADPSGERYVLGERGGLCAVDGDGTLYIIQGDEGTLTRYTKAGGYSDPEVVTTGASQVIQAEGSVYYAAGSENELKAAQVGGEHTFTMTGESVDDTVLFVYGDGTLYAMTYKDQFEGYTLSWPSGQGEWAEVTAGIQSMERLEGDRLVMTTTDTRDNSEGGYRLFSWEDGQLKVIANGVTGFCCPLAQEPEKLYP